MLLKKKSLLIGISVLLAIACAAIFGIILLPPPVTTEKYPLSAQETRTDVFTFLNVGPDTPYSKLLKKQLEDRLGDGSSETRTTIDLVLPGIADFDKHFPGLQELHQRLNSVRFQRAEHDTLQLTYRYARKKDVPFDVIRLVFSGKSSTPLYLTLFSKKDGAEFINTIRGKYGEPQTIDQGEGAEPVRFWQKDNALFIISVTKDRMGVDEYNFGIYYLDNITALADAEEKARREIKQKQEQTGGMVF